MNKEAVIVMLDCHSTMGKLFLSDTNKRQGNQQVVEDKDPDQMGAQLDDDQDTRFTYAIDSVKMLLEQKVSRPKKFDHFPISDVVLTKP